MSATHPRRARRILSAILIGALLVLLMLWLAGVFSTDLVAPGTLPPGTRPWNGPVHVVDRREIPLREGFEGAVRSVRTTLLSPRVGGPVLTLVPRPGDRIEAGSVYGTLEKSRLEATLAVAEAGADAAERSRSTARSRLTLVTQARASATAALDLARKEHARTTELAGTGAATAADLDTAVARLRQAETADLEALTAIELAERGIAEAEGLLALRQREAEKARLDLTFADLRSGVAGIVVRRLVEPGTQAIPGQPVLEVYDPGDLRLEVAVREGLAPRLLRDRDYQVRIPALDRTFDARIVEVAPFAEEGSRSVIVRFALPADPGLFPGMSGAIDLIVTSRDSLVVPQAALIRIGQLVFVDVVEGGALQRRFVRIGRLVDGGVEVIDGLQVGEAVALVGEEARDG